MKVKVCTSGKCHSPTSVEDASKKLEEKIQEALDEMQENGFYLKHIKYSSNADNTYHEKSAVLIFDSEK